MPGTAVRRLGQRLASSANGNPGPGPAGQGIWRQATVTAVRADSIDVLFPGDDPDDPAAIGWISFEPPSVNDVGWVVQVGTTAIWAGTQNVQAPAGAVSQPARWLGEEHSSLAFTHTTGAVTTMLQIDASVPAGVDAQTIRVIGTVGQASSASGVGVNLDITGAPGGQATITAGGMSGGMQVIRYDQIVIAGVNTYTLTLATTVSGQQVSARSVTLEAWII